MPSPVHPYSDYGIALRTLKSSRGWLGMLLLFCVIMQFVGFSLVWWTTQPYEQMKPTYARPATRTASVANELRAWLTNATRPSAATEPAALPPIPNDAFFPGTEQGRRLNIRNQWETAYTMLVPVTQLAGLIAVSSQAIIVFITLLVVLVAQAPGVAQITRSLIWSVLLLFMFLPWQYFARDFPIPGVIYGYSDLLRLIAPLVVAPQPGEHIYSFQIWLVYGRFIAWPLIGLFVLLITSERYRAGVMIAIGHPLQSILQPRSGTSPAGGPPGKPLPPIPAAAAKNRV